MRVLVVEDEPDIADFVSRGLREAGYAVDTVHDGRAALDCLQLTPFDCVVLDRLLPALDGLELCRRLRSDGSDVPILMLTARDSVQDRVDGLEAGADDYLVKPFAFAELLARVRALLRRPPALDDPAIEIADLRIDLAARACTRAGRPIDLTAREFAVLETLARNAGRVLSREAIADAAWDYRYEAGSNVIDVHIRNLRRKLDDPFPIRLIETVRGAGYRLRSPDPS